MKAFKKLISVSAALSLFCVSAISAGAADEVTMTSGLEPEEYVRSLLSGNIQIVDGSVKLSCTDPDQIASFTGMSEFLDFDNGLMLSSGNAVNWMTDASNLFYTDFTDADVTVDIGRTDLYDGISLEFTIIANGPELTFDYSAFSQEFGQDKTYGDYFGLFVNGENIARFDDGTAINIYTMYTNGMYTAASEENPIGNFNGVSNKFTCSKKVTIGDEVTIKLIVCDTGDYAYDTAVAIAGNSITFNPELTDDDFDSNGNISFTQDGAETVNKPFEIYPTGNYTKISTDGVNWYDFITVSEPGENAELTIYMKMDNGVISLPKTVYYTLIQDESSEISEPVSEPDIKDSSTEISSSSASSDINSSASDSSSVNSSKPDTSKDKNPNTGVASVSASAVILAAAAVTVKRRK